MVDREELRRFLARILGWADEQAIDNAVRSVDLAAAHLAHLVLCGAGDLVPLAYALHRRALGRERPFVVCDPRRGDTRQTVRAPANRSNGLCALDVVRGGSLCVRAARLPRDFGSMVTRSRALDEVVLIVCTDERAELGPFLARPAPLRIQPIASRVTDLARVISEYAEDAIANLGATHATFTAADGTWVREHASTTLAEIESATQRLVAVRSSRSLSEAAARLGMAPVSLSRWLGRRGLRRMPRNAAGNR